MDGAPSDDWHPDTWLVAGGRDAGPGDPLNVPPVLASTFVADGAHSYTRVDGSPTLEALEALVGRLEGGTATAFGSGMAACSAVLDQVPAESHLVLPGDCYHGVAGLADDGMARGRWTVDRLPVADADAWVAAAPAADVLWLESPSNPLLEVADLAPICAAGHASDALVVVDNTFATPLNQRPLEFGADVVVHSATKFIGGHSDLLAGVTVTRDADLDAALRRSRMLLGAIPGALEAFLAIRGARTLALRLERGQANAGELAVRLQDHPRVRDVRYPGLPDHPTHDTARRVLDGFGAIVTFEVDGDAEETEAFIGRLEVVHSATSLGGVESTIERRARWSGQEHLPPGLVRLSVGCEHVDDLWADLARGLG
ncbi:MAG: cystathionine gamma-synthase [Acidimicrobiaceae bacterium]|nr:cystathionine gamma-synthase [Acidimicrobiaceae bacterium]